jgi:hypothetical protein
MGGLQGIYGWVRERFGEPPLLCPQQAPAGTGIPSPPATPQAQTTRVYGAIGISSRCRRRREVTRDLWENKCAARKQRF